MRRVWKSTGRVLRWRSRSGRGSSVPLVVGSERQVVTEEVGVTHEVLLSLEQTRGTDLTTWVIRELFAVSFLSCSGLPLSERGSRRLRV